MIIDILQNKSLDSEWEKKNIRLILERSQTGTKKLIAQSVEFHWCDVTGTLDGKIEVFHSNSLTNKSFCCDYLIDTPDNRNNTSIFTIDQRLEFMNIKFIKNNITGGLLTAKLNYL